ncbi:cytochrome d ubiquinol oxidase subunit II [Plantibacter flavus]|uniref:hypothetical protein n=1 Tax=Plantibacter flavus TaxID=150123 RepID=UPI003F17E5C6
MRREDLRSLGVAAPGAGNARFLDEGDASEANAVVFAPLDGAWTVYATDHRNEPVESTRQSFESDAAAFDYMYECLKLQKADRVRPTPLVGIYRGLGVAGVFSGICTLVTMFGWLWMSPFAYSWADTMKYSLSSDDRGKLIFPAESGLVVVAACYSLAAIHMVLQWSWGRRGDEAARRRAQSTAVGTAVFATLALVCMGIRSSQVSDLSFWFPPVIALGTALATALTMFARRPDADGGEPAPGADEGVGSDAT